MCPAPVMWCGLSTRHIYRYQSDIANGDVDALIDANRKQPNLRNQAEVVTETLDEAKVLIQYSHINFSITQPHQGIGASMIKALFFM